MAPHIGVRESRVEPYLRGPLTSREMLRNSETQSISESEESVRMHAHTLVQKANGVLSQSLPYIEGTRIDT